MLRPEFPGVNHKRIFRLYQLNNLAVLRRKKPKRPINTRVSLTIATAVNQVWSVDIAVDFGIGGQYVTRLLDQAALIRGCLQSVRTLARDPCTGPQYDKFMEKGLQRNQTPQQYRQNPPSTVCTGTTVRAKSAYQCTLDNNNQLTLKTLTSQMQWYGVWGRSKSVRESSTKILLLYYQHHSIQSKQTT
jgi:hypothetical protein